MQYERWQDVPEEQQRKYAAQILRGMAIDGKAPTGTAYAGSRPEGAPSMTVLRKWFDGMTFNQIIRSVGLEITRERGGLATFAEVDREIAEELEHQRRMAGNFGFVLTKQPSTRRPIRYFDTSARRWVNTTAVTGAFSLCV